MKDPDVSTDVKIGGKLSLLLILYTDCTDANTPIDTFKTAVTEAAIELQGKKRTTKKPWVTIDLLKLCGPRRDFRQLKYDSTVMREWTSTGNQICRLR